MKLFLCILLMSPGCRALAQDNSPGDSNRYKIEFRKLGLKTAFIILPIGNGHITSSLLGINGGFLKRHHAGIDFNYITAIDQSDNISDTLGVMHGTGKQFNSKETAFFSYYNYDFNIFHWQERKGISLFTGIYYRFGRGSFSYDPLFQADYINRHSINYSLGWVLGVIQRFKDVKRLALGWTVGVFEKKWVNDLQYRENSQVLYKTERITNWGIKIDLSLHVKLF